ncbi:MAG TPA: LacI family DNA-binding transcriptional regulator [Bacillales bacterium]|nr:LacI family DNA-binding transcriptional regulator [Bacillales bacterium]
MAATIKDVAKLANTSKSTVSRYLNGQRVKKQTEEALKKAIKQLNYHPNMNARRLVMDRTQVLGIVVDDIANRFYSGILKGIRIVAERHGYDCVFYTWSTHREKETDFLNLLYEELADGLIFLSFRKRSAAHVKAMAEMMDPIVLIGDDADVEEICSVDVDNYSGVRELVHYLHRIGHRDFAYISGPRNAGATEQRANGFFDALSENGLQVNRNWVVGSDWSNEGGYKAMKKLIKSGGFSAVVASNDESALGAIGAAHEEGYRIPKDFSIVGFDDIPLSKWFYPSLTTVKQPFTEIGMKAAEVLFEQIDDKKDEPGKRHLLNPRLVIRNSCLRMS